MSTSRDTTAAKEKGNYLTNEEMCRKGVAPLSIGMVSIAGDAINRSIFPLLFEFLDQFARRDL